MTLQQKRRDEIKEAAAAIQAGKIIVYPTDTAYAIGCDFTNNAAIQKILQIKGRTDEKFTVIAATQEQVAKHFEFGKLASQYAEEFWPGPLSIAVNDQFSVRIPASDTAQAIAYIAQIPIIASSANKTGGESTFSLEDAKKALKSEEIAVWIDGGRLEKKEPSTIIKEEKGKITVIRQGSIHIRDNE